MLEVTHERVHTGPQRKRAVAGGGGGQERRGLRVEKVGLRVCVSKPMWEFLEWMCIKKFTGKRASEQVVRTYAVRAWVHNAVTGARREQAAGAGGEGPHAVHQRAPFRPAC